MEFWSRVPGNGDDRTTVRRKVISTTVITVAMVIMATGAFLALSPPGSRTDLWFLFPAVCAMSACYLVLGLVGALVRGTMASLLRTGIQFLSLALLIGLLSIFLPNGPKGMLGFGLLLILTGFATMAAYIAKGFSDHYWLAGRAAALMLLGITLESGLGMTGAADLLSGIPLMVMLAVGLLSLFGIVHQHSNIYVRSVGQFFRSASNMIALTVVLTLVLVYAFRLRGAIADQAPEQTLLGEWIVLAIVVIVVVFKFFSFFRSKEKKQDFLDTRRLVQSIYQNRGDTIYAQRVVDQFIVEGRREPLVVLLATVLLQGRADPNQIERIIEGVVSYAPKEQRHTFRWAFGNEEAMTREERTRIAFEALDRAAQALGAGYLMSSAPNQTGIAEG